MSAGDPTSVSRGFMPILGGIILIAVGLYFIFWAVNTLGLENRSATATVTGKEYHPPGTSYQSQYIAGRNYTRLLRTPEQYVVLLHLLDQTAAGAVEPVFYERLKPGDQVRVSYQRRRLTGSLAVTKIAATNEGGPF